MVGCGADRGARRSPKSVGQRAAGAIRPRRLVAGTLRLTSRRSRIRRRQHHARPPHRAPAAAYYARRRPFRPSSRRPRAAPPLARARGRRPSPSARSPRPQATARASLARAPGGAGPGRAVAVPPRNAAALAGPAAAALDTKGRHGRRRRSAAALSAWQLARIHGAAADRARCRPRRTSGRLG